MLQNPRRILLLLSFHLLLLSGAPGQSQVPWWNNAWKYRVALKVDHSRWGQTIQAAHAMFFIPADVHPEGHDIRVTDSKGKLLNSETKFFALGRFGVVAFQVDKNESQYFLYMGNPSAPAVKSDWQARAGVFLTTWQLAPGNFRAWNIAQKMFESPVNAFGGGFVETIHNGYNLFGEPDLFMSYYSAWLLVPAEGTYDFCAVADDMAYLLVNGKLVCQASRRNPRAPIPKNQTGSIKLERGLHHMEYYHFEHSGEQIASAGWKRPAEKNFSLFKSTNFAHIFKAERQFLQVRNQPVASDLVFEQNEYLLYNDMTFTDFTFRNAARPEAGLQKSSWQFSDGFAAEGIEITRPFFQKGDFLVSLKTIDRQGNESEITWPLTVFAIDKEEQVAEARIIRDFQQRIREFPTHTLDAASISMAGAFLEAERQWALAEDLYKKTLDYHLRNKDTLEVPILIRLTRMATHPETKNPGQARTLILKYAQSIPQEHPARAEFYEALARLELESLHQPEMALTSARTALRSIATASRDLKRDIWITTGDTHKFMGNAEEARKAYLKAAEFIPVTNQHPFEISSYALTVESYLQSGELEEAEKILTTWQLQYPIERINGNASILQAKLLAAQRNVPRAIRELEAYLSCDAYGVFAQQSLELLGDLQVQEKRYDEARAAYNRLLQDFQDRELRSRVETKINKIPKR